MSLLARIRARLAAHESEPEPVAEATPDLKPEVAPDEAPVPPCVVHQFGSQYLVRVDFGELMARRGRTETAAAYRRSLDARGDARRDAAAGRLGYTPGELLWPPE